MSKRTVIYFFILSFFLGISCNTLQRINNNDPSNPLYGPPPIPTGFKSNIGNASVTLSWTAVYAADLAGYNIYRSTTSGKGFLKINSSIITTISYSDSGLTNDTKYYYKITSIDFSGNESDYSNEISAMLASPPPDTTPPAAPSGLNASAGDSSVVLSWTANSESDLAGYNIYRSTSSTTGFSKINSLLVTAKTYSDSGLTNGATYYYKITAIDTSSNESDFSSIANATPSAPAPSNPTGLTALKNTSTHNIELSWNANPESDIVGYNVYRAKGYEFSSGLSFQKRTSTPITGVIYIDVAPTAWETFTYAVKAVNSHGKESAYSNYDDCFTY